MYVDCDIVFGAHWWTNTFIKCDGSKVISKPADISILLLLGYC